MKPILGLDDPEESKSPAVEGSIEEAEDWAPLELTVIVPVRDEAVNLPGCLESLLRQTEPGFALGREWELIVVNDASTDGTRAIAEAAAAEYPATEMGAAVTVMDAPPLDTGDRGGFTGKNNACWAGAQMARGRRLLFTDADTIHEAGGLSRSLREAERHGADLLSYSPRQIVTGAVQRSVMPLIFSELASVYPPEQVNDPNRRVAAANGQFLSVDRRAYFDLGGHRAVGRSVLEDVALATDDEAGAANGSVPVCARGGFDADVSNGGGDGGGLDEEPGAADAAPGVPGGVARAGLCAVFRAADGGAGDSAPGWVAEGGDPAGVGEDGVSVLQPGGALELRCGGCGDLDPGDSDVCVSAAAECGSASAASIGDVEGSEL